MDNHPPNPLILDRHLSASQARGNAEVKRVLTAILKGATVQVHLTYFYRVDFGPEVRPQQHIVSHDLYCTCSLEVDCPAVTAVKYYLQKEKGTEARKPRPGFFPAVPHHCPSCGATAHYEPRLTSKHRGLGWACEKGGISCYWRHQAQALEKAYAEKWKRLGVDPASFPVQAHFAYPAGYDPKWVSPAPLPICPLSLP